jgi:hypothetical protein
MTDNVFKTDNSVQEIPASQTESKQDSTLDYTTFESKYIGQDKKYSSIEDALKSVDPSQDHIKTLEQELATIKEELNKRQTAEELLQAIRREQPSTSNSAETTPPQLSPEDIEKVVSQHITKREQEQTSQKNLEEAVKPLFDKLGDEAKVRAFIAEKAKGLNMTPEELGATAAKSPTAFQKLISDGTSSQVTQTTEKVEQSTVNTLMLGHDATSPEAVKAQFDELRRKDFNKWSSAEVQRQIMELAKQGKIKL